MLTLGQAALRRISGCVIDLFCAHHSTQTSLRPVASQRRYERPRSLVEGRGTVSAVRIQRQYSIIIGMKRGGGLSTGLVSIFTGRIEDEARKVDIITVNASFGIVSFKHLACDGG